MGLHDTSIGGAGRRFNATAWSIILSFQGGEEEDRRQALTHLVEQYWKPIYYFIRLEWKKSNDESKDLAQQFFAQLIEQDWIAQADRERGSFRAFLKTSLRNFLRQDHRGRQAVKRGAGHAPISLQMLTEADRQMPDGRCDPGAALDQEWRRVQIGLALQRLGEEYALADKQSYYQVFMHYHFSAEAEPTHAAVAEACGVSAHAVNNYLRDARPRFRRLLRAVVAGSVNSAEELEDEFRMLFGEGFDG